MSRKLANVEIAALKLISTGKVMYIVRKQFPIMWEGLIEDGLVEIKLTEKGERELALIAVEGLDEP
jgi:hypothetical protein